ncbi:MAG: hypothetical protein IT580_05905 [Verrucomicrobiales bacterium]|nr:hypothetical protein [Verrucomicrobiales bacterium]
MNTKSLILGVAALVAVGVGSGCVVSVGGDSDHQHVRHEVSKPAPVVLPAVTPDDAGVMAEIDAATRLGLEGSRVEVLGHVASRAGLSPACQVHLVNIGLRHLQLEGSRYDLLTTLIQNPAFSAPAKEAILRQVEFLGLENNRRQVITLIQQRAAGS